MDDLTGYIDSEGLECVISEMANDPTSSGINITIDRDKLAKIKDRDENPQFVTVAIESGWSRSNRHWKPEMLENIAKQVNSKKPVGYKGHMTKTEIETKFPDPQTIWLGAKTVKEGNKTVLWVKGYNLPKADVRDLLEHEAVNSVSVFGNSKMKPVKGGYEVIDFDLESIDWSRKNQSGMSARVMAVTSEMESKGGNSVEPKEIAALDEAELRAHAPLLVKEIERKAVEPIETQIGEMTAEVEKLQPEVDVLGKVKELLGITEGENVVEKVTALISKIEDTSASEIKAYIKEAIAKKVKTERGQALVARLIGEMHTEYDGETLDDELKAKIDADLETKIEGDEVVKEIIGEMSNFTEDENKGKGSGQGGSALGGKGRSGSSRGATEDGVVSKNAHMTVRKRTLA